jgi:hypothetical protein
VNSNLFFILSLDRLPTLRDRQQSRAGQKKLIFQSFVYIFRIVGHESGSKKRKQKQKEQNLIQSQKGAMDRFVKREKQVASDNQSVDPSTLAPDIIPYNDPTDETETENNVEVEEDHIDEDHIEEEHVDDFLQPDIFDPRYWDYLNSKYIDILAQKGPRRDLSPIS